MKLGRALSGLGTGLLFGTGLAISQMANPEKVLAFLNLAGHWDPSLLFVMGAAVLVAMTGFRVVAKGQPLYDSRLYLPTSRQIDMHLITGAGVFGLGWGLAGFCPGPAITSITSGSVEPLVFLAAMIAGSQMARLYLREPLRVTQ